MQKISLRGFTDWALVVAAISLTAVEIAAVVGKVEFITNEFVEFSIHQLWIPFFVGSLMGHFFPLPWRVLKYKKEPTARFLLIVLGSVGVYIGWYVIAPESVVLRIVEILADHMWAFFLIGYLSGSEWFHRPKKEGEI